MKIEPRTDGAGYSLTVCDGKYTFLTDEALAIQEVRRYGEEWSERIQLPIHYKAAISALLSEAFELQGRMDGLEK